jgi:hypothetical protein
MVLGNNCFPGQIQQHPNHPASKTTLKTVSTNTTVPETDRKQRRFGSGRLHQGSDLKRALKNLSTDFRRNISMLTQRNHAVSFQLLNDRINLRLTQTIGA